MVGHLLQHLDLGVQGAERRHVGRVEQRARVVLARVAERPHALAVRGRDRPLDRVLDPVAVADVLDQADRGLDGGRRVVLEPEREREVEEHLRVGRALDLPVERGVDGEHEVALDLVEVADHAVVHPQPAAVPERMAVRLLDRRARRGPDVGEHERGLDVSRQLTQVAVVPGGLDAVEEAGRLAGAVPADAESVTVRRLGAELRVEALVDQRVLRLVEQVLDRVSESPSMRASGTSRLLSCQWWKLDAAELSWIGCGCCCRRGSCRFRSLTSMSAMSCVKPCFTTTRSAARSVRFSGNV